MKYIISESQRDSFIYNYLENNYSPDYAWGTDFHGFYKEYFEKHQMREFVSENQPVFVYYNWRQPTLKIFYEVGEELTNLFGDLWRPVFKKWFIDNTGHPVSNLVIAKPYFGL